MSRVKFQVTFNIIADIDVDMDEVVESLTIDSALNGRTIEIYDVEVEDYNVEDSK